MTRGVIRAERSPLSEEVKAELARIHPAACDARVLASLLPRAKHLGVPARRLAHSTETKVPFTLRKACCRRAYLRGLFLAGGSLSAGPSGYLLEVRPPRGEATRSRHELITARIMPATRVRRGRTVHSVRSAEAIATFLRLAGATETLFRFESRRVSREMRGRTNAAVNAESANLARTVVAAREQADAIRRLVRAGRLSRLPASLRDAAAARLRAPDASLAQLADRLDATKWSVRQRLRRLIDEAAR